MKYTTHMYVHMCESCNTSIPNSQFFFSDLLGSTYPFVVLTLSTMSIMTAQFSSVFISLVAFSRTRKLKNIGMSFWHNYATYHWEIIIYRTQRQRTLLQVKKQLIYVKWLNVPSNVSLQSTVKLCILLHVWFSLMFLQKSFVFIYQ